MYNVILEKQAEKFFRKLDRKDQEKIGKKIINLAKNPKLGKVLTADLSGLWSLRVDKYRLIYEIKNNELLILVLDIGHRKNVYR